MKLIIPLTWLLGLTVLVQGENLLTNGNFETGLVKGHFVDGYPDGWDGWGTNGWHHADPGFRYDNYGIAIWDNNTGLAQTFSVLPGMQLTVSGQMIYHTKEILTSKKALLKIEFWNGPVSSGTKLSESVVGMLTGSDTAGRWYSF